LEWDPQLQIGLHTPPYICFLDIWCDLYFMMTEDPAIIFGSWDCESGSDMANS